MEGIRAEIIKLLGDFLAEKINISPPAAKGLIKLAIKDEIGPFKLIDQVNLSELKLILQNSLKNRILNIGIKNVDNIIELIQKVLVENQSLLTMSKV